MNIAVFANVAIFVLAMYWLARRAKNGSPLSTNVLIAVLLGAALGAAAQAVYGLGSAPIRDTLTWVGIVGSGYVRLLQMVIAPLVLISILAAVTKLSNARSLGAIAGGVLGMLMVTVALSAVIGIGMTTLFGLRADGLVQGARELERG
ncbi:MAG: cation:dicarboxylase symporter family transporter, partial [Acidobacteriota bacterium]|nr:cation:dicarboxylase symporter family transporter [Acidobacteriota bacterium]